MSNNEQLAANEASPEKGNRERMLSAGENILRAWQEVEHRMEEEANQRKARRAAREVFEPAKEPIETHDIIEIIRRKNLERNKQEFYDSSTEKEESELEELSAQEKQMREKMRSLQMREMIATARILRKQEDIIERETLISGLFPNDRNENTDIMDRKVADAQEKLRALPESSRDAYYVVHGMELRKNIKELENGRMVETPYVEYMSKTLADNMEAGQPSFIHGHLGSGKTELALTVAKKVAINKVAKERTLEELERVYEENPEIGEDVEKLNETLYSIYKKTTADIEEGVRTGKSDEDTERCVPLLISGSKNLTTQDLYTEKSLRLAHSVSGNIAEQVKEYNAEFADFQKSREGEYSKLPLETRTRKEAEDAVQFNEMYKMRNQAFGTEVEVIEKELYRAIKEGRPIILDEINAIPAGVLISLNDVLQRKPGDTCYVPGEGLTKIQPGFSITMTGNLNTNGIEYVGTEKLNPAFLSRLKVMEYDYLPQSIEGTLDDKDRNPGNDELFRVLISSLVDKKGNLRLPDIEENTKKIYHLAQLARLSQEIFSGKQVDMNDNGAGYRARLTESVMSIRNVLRVLAEWNKGRSMDLDTALWKGFISGIEDNNEQNLMLQLAHDRFGFFNDTEGWNFEAKRPGEVSTFFEDNIDRLEGEYQSQPLEFYSTAQVVDLIFGDRPERTEYPDLDTISEELTDDQKEELFEKAKNYLSTLEQEITALETLGEQCGCENVKSLG